MADSENEKWNPEKLKASDQFNEEEIKEVLKKFIKITKKVIVLKNQIYQEKKIEENKMSTDVKIPLPVFDGQGYAMWKKRLLTFLRLKKCEEVAIRKMNNTEREAEWQEQELKALNYIYCVISDKQMEFVDDETTPYGIIEKFDKMYLRKSTALQICVRNQLESIKLSEFSECEEFFSAFEKLTIDLKNSGATVSEKEKMNYMLRSLPNEYNHIGDVIDALKEEDQTVEFVMNKIKLFEKQNKESSKKGNSSAFKSEIKKDKKCFGCGKFGHYKSECWHENKSTPSSWRGRGQQRGGAQRNWQRGQPNRSSWHRQATSRRGQGRQHNSEYQYNNDNYEQRVGNSFYVQVEENNNKGKRIEINNTVRTVDWILDSGCSDHVINDEKYFNKYTNLQNPICVKVGDGRILKATKIGNVICNFRLREKSSEVIINDVYYVKEMDRNLISYGKVTEKNKIVSEGKMSKIYNHNRELIAVARKVNNIYIMESSEVVKSNFNSEKVSSNITMKEKLHKMLGHVNFKYLDIMCKENLLVGLPDHLEDEYLKCGTCIKNKMHNLTFNNNRKRATDLLEIIHADLNGPHNTTGFNGEKYFLTIIDDYSKLVKVYPINSKDQVSDCFEEYINTVENITEKRVKTLRCDNGTEFLNNKMYKITKEKGIIIETCPPYVHQLNGVAERYNRTIMDTARCLMYDSKLNMKYWPETVKTVAYLKNRTLANTKERKSPYEIFLREKPNIKNLKVFGSKVFVRVPEVKRANKWDRKADIGILVGYETNGYRILINNKIKITNHVDIIEENEKLVGFNGNDELEETLNTENVNVSDDENYESFEKEINENKIRNEKTPEHIKTSTPDLRRSNRQKKQTKFYQPEANPTYIYVNYVNAMSPKNYNEAINSNDRNEWEKAMDHEIDCLYKNETWELVKKPENKKIIDLKWIYTRKQDNSFRARLVAKGFQQREHLPDLYSPVAKMQTLKLLLAYCVKFNLMINQMDVESAFLNGKISSEVYVKQPEGYEDGTENVCKLKKTLYGLRESPRAWYECLDKFLLKTGFKRSKYDYCLYTMEIKIDKIYLIIFVDDILVCCKKQQNLDKVKRSLVYHFKIKDLGLVKNYLGININYDQKIGKMTLSQEKYIESLAEKYELHNAKLYNTPMEENLKCQPAINSCENIKYRNLIGELLYISYGTRPDISFSVNYLSRFQSCYDSSHYKYALRILKYLYYTKELKFNFDRCFSEDILTCYVDADWAGDPIDRRSTTGYIISLFGNIIEWKSKKQNSVTKSSTQAEYVALSEAVSEVLSLKDLLTDFEINIVEPIKIYEDNLGAVDISHLGNFTKKSKYIEVHYHFVNENYVDGIIDIIKIETNENIADILTKALGRNKFEYFKENLNLY